MKIDQLARKLIANTADIKDIILPNHSNDILASFKASYPVDFFKICFESAK